MNTWRKVCCCLFAAVAVFGAWAETPTAADYTRDGLVAQWDGIDNAGTGTHDSSAATWIDRVGNRTVTRVDKSGGGSWGENCFVEGSSATSAFWVEDDTLKNAIAAGNVTVEILCEHSTSTASGKYEDWLGFGKDGSSRWLKLDIRTGDVNPSTKVFQGLQYRTTTWNNSAKVPDNTVFDWGVPQYAAIVCEGTTATLYGNGSNKVHSVSYGTTTPTDGVFTLGGFGKGGNALINAKIYAVRIYNRALTAKEMAYNYAVDQYRFCNNPEPYFALSNFRVQPIPGQAFTGAAIMPDVQVSFIGTDPATPLTKDSDYTVTCENNVGLGTARMTITGIGTYKDEIPLKTTFNIVPPPADERIRLEGTFEPKAVTFGSAAKIRDLRVLGADGQPLADGTYEVNYLNNTATGTATVWARGTSGTAEGALAAATFDVKVLPEGYVPLEWIASTGEQLIDTGYVPTTAKTGVDIRFGQVKNAGSQAIFAQSWAWGNGFLLQANPAFRFENNKTIDGYAEGRDYHLTILPGGTVTMDFGEGPTTTTGFGNGTRANTHLGLFAPGDNGNYRATFRLYGCTITDAGTPVRDFVPVLRVTDWKPGLVDMLDTDASTCFYANARTGKDFEMGPMATDFVVESSSLPPQRPDGTEKRPIPVIIDKATGEVVPAENFTYSYANNVESGTARVTATGVAGTPVEGVTVYATFYISKLIFATFEGAGVQDGTSWENAMAPQAALTAAQTVYDAGGFAQVFFKAGNYPLTAALTLNKPAYVYGGCLGASGTSLELAGDDAETTFDGQGSMSAKSTIAQAITVSSGVAGKLNLFERCGFGRFQKHGFVKTGASDIRFRKCRFFNNTWKHNENNLTGRGFCLTGTANTEAFFEDCDVSGNGDLGEGAYSAGYGFGGYVSTFKRVFIDNTTFVTNGWGIRNHGTALGCALYATAAPVTVRSSSFVGNEFPHSTAGGTVYLTGASGGSAFTNVLFLANSTHDDSTYGPGTKSGALHIEFASNDDTLDVDHCTFAYNLHGATYTHYVNYLEYGSAAGLDVGIGKARVRNCIFWGNSISSEDAAGADIYVREGSADVDWSLFGGLGVDNIRAYGGGSITLGEHVFVGDPQFVTRPETVKAAFSSYASPRSTATSQNMKYSTQALAASFDAHLVSSPTVYSAAIDMADPSEGVVNEPDPNGGIANLGCYGNTAGAATTGAGAQTLGEGDVQIAFPNGFSLPEVTFTTGAADELPSNARVTVFAGTDPGNYELRMDFTGVRAGDSRTAAFMKAFAAGETLYVKVVVSVPGQDDVVVTKTAAVEGSEPEWYGHGGNAAKVVHVRAGSTARNPKGTSWTDAYPSIEAANGALTETRNEMWVAGEFVYTVAPVDFTLGAPATIRGGFAGTEDSADERAEGAVSTLDGSGKCIPLRLKINKDLTIERMRFTRGCSRGVTKGGCRGGVTFNDCEFICNGAADGTAIAGAAFYGEYASYVKTDIAFNRCRFEGNGRTISNNAQLDGACIHVKELKSLTVSDCTFLTNGAPFSLAVNGTGCVRPVGTCVYANATPSVIERCRFAGNRTCCYKTDQVGGLIYFTGTCDDSVVRNCAFVGNECVTRTNTKNDGGSIGGMIVANLGEAIRSIYVENCTFAWDFASGLSVPADICAHKGIINVKNSIFFGGQVGDQTAAGTGRYLNANANGTVNVAYSMFDVAFTNAAGAAGVNVGATCMTNSPAFVTANLDLPVWRDAAANVFQRYTNEAERVAISGDVHNLSPAGYWDNAGGYHEDADRVSPAIDAGDPADDCSNEPTPNGGFINLGAYGNTTNASKTVTIRPEIVDEKIDVTFPNDTSLPNVAFDLKASSVDYTAVATVYCGAEDGVWDASSPALPIRGGEHFSWQCLSAPYPAGSTVFVKVVITSGDYVVEKTVSATASGEMPKWYGKGGGARVLHVWADAPGAGTGASWRDAFRTFDEAIDAFDPSAHDEIWVCGDYTLGKTGSFSPTAAFAVRGGFDACENDPEERTAGTISHVDGFNSYNAFVIANGADAPVTIDRMSVDNCYDRAIAKSGGGDLMVTDCQILTNGVHGTYKKSNTDYTTGAGKGIRILSAESANIVITGTLFSGNRLNDDSTNQTTGQGNGSGIYMDSGASLMVTDCQFYCNGHPLVAPSTSHSGNPRAGGIAGSAIYSTVPTTVSFSRFCGNTCICDGTAGGVIALRGAAGGSIIRNCVFAGNLDMTNGTNGPGGDSVTGGLAIMLDDAAGEVEVVNNTFAYNISAGKTAAAGLTVKKGVANVRNCVFWGNRLQASGVTDVARDINVRETGTCNVSYSILSADDATSYTKAIGGVLNDGDWVGMSFGDPLLVSPESCVTDYLKNISTTHIQWDSAKKPDYTLWTIDVHEKSCGGYFNNAGDELHDVEEGVISMAVDAGSADDLVGDEPDPNGGRINAGAYGGTAQASMSAFGAPAVDGDITIAFPDGTTRPEIGFTVGGEGTFLATAEIYLSSDGGDTWTLVRTQGGIAKGQFVSYYVPAVYLPTDRLVAKVVLTGGSSGGAVEATSDVIVPSDKKLPHWYGHGGDSNKVIHVRADAFGDGSGRDWANAVNGFHAAMAMLTETRNEIWLAVSNINDAASKNYAPEFPIVIRGGFAATEDRIEERADGVRSFIDGEGKNNNLVLANAHPVYIERIEFLRGSSRAFEKSASAGDLTMVDCAFLRTTATANTNPEGRGGRFEGSSGKTATLALTNCVFGQNGYSGVHCMHIAAYFKNFKDVFLDNCLFATNGAALNSSAGGNSGATCFGASGAKITATNCRFIGNNTSSSSNGGLIYLLGGCGGSEFRNCAFVGNLERRVTYDATICNGGCIYVNGNFQERMRVLVENCTFAYNLVGSGARTPAALQIARGDVTVKNCIFHANALAANNPAPVDIYVRKDADDPQGTRCTVTYSMFDGFGADWYGAAAEGLLSVDTATCCTNDPNFVSTTGEFLLLVNCGNKTPTLPRMPVSDTNGNDGNSTCNLIFKNDAASLAKILALNVHLRGGSGYRDEATGQVVRDWTRKRYGNSLAIDTGDPAVKCVEPSPNGNRVNLGAYGNTPWATMSKGGTLIFVR